MVVKETGIQGCFIIKPRVFKDFRGSLTKIHHSESFKDLGLAVDFKEEYFSISNKGVIRGLHFQIPPMDHAKCVTCLRGSIFDVAVDLRKSSPTFGKYFSLIIDSLDPVLLYVPSGMAHGFMALEDDSLFLNRSTTIYSPECDRGINWNSCGIQWPEIEKKISEKDLNMPDLNDFNSPF